MFKRQDVIVTLWMTFLTIVAWISFGIYHIWTTSTLSEIDISAISTIDPNFDTNTINMLKNREMINPIYHITENKKDASTKVASDEANISPIPTANVILQISGAP
jgi:hypothetical protein